MDNKTITIELTGYGHAAAVGPTVVGQTGQRIPPAGRRLAAALASGDYTGAARILRRCPSLRGRLDGVATVALSCGHACLASVRLDREDWPGHYDGRGWALRAAEILSGSVTT